ncbi:HAMP domain-containing sensor histidine kinase [Clostridium beijerinckii]|uniref:histidine kinase n=1 Tax=Clostridium beijerinckii TaxID=1520 RepID=A0AAX0AXR3_CLOBE|nr:HAMP domain-containing sensor histidine kinase [Clostridium beijerinckii]NRT87769.1 signal transduction histidine kinase [Clostridium beijerinckii]NYC73199.1 signal transduction histidine kinase [Clostridium beijerinckii]
MRRSLSKRLFSITLGLVLALMFITYFAQAFFFESFYSYKKTISLVKEVNKFHDLYSLHIDNDADLYKALQKFENDNNAKIIITSTNGDIKYFSNNIYSDKESFDTLTSFGKELINNSDLINDVITHSQTKYTTFTNESSGLSKIGVISPMSITTKNDSLIFCVASIQPIKEASEVMSEFFVYLFFGLIVISVILSSIYSNLISKPLVNLTNTANKISHMDFSARVYETDRDDEIGSLAKSLNFLSKNLQAALVDLQQKNKKLEDDIEKERQLEDMRKDFISNVSHELKTPIGIIEGYAEGIKDGIVSGEDANLYLETIIDESKKMTVLVTNMLELSKLESGIIKPNFESFNINRLITKILKKHKPDFEENKFNVNFNSSIPYSYVYADPFQMEQVLTNLITNAIKYTPPGNDINVNIEEGLDKFKISVQNMGVVIPEAEIRKLFDKFYRIDKSRERTQKNSTGIGLSIVKNILRLHNSEFNLQNINNGVEFYFYLEKIVSPEGEEE